jgi:hypothetical protein
MICSLDKACSSGGTQCLNLQGQYLVSAHRLYWHGGEWLQCNNKNREDGFYLSKSCLDYSLTLKIEAIWSRRMPSSEMWGHVALIRTDISEERIASGTFVLVRATWCHIP